jgi:hypothetical protein
MKKIVLLMSLMTLFSLITQAQKSGADSSKKNKSSKLGIKAGLNFANVTKASSINTSSQTGFHAGLFFGGGSKSILGSRTELMYSQQGSWIFSATKPC